MRGKLQGGSLAGFIIVGVLLALVLVGGLYGLNRYNAEQNNKETAQETSNEEEKSNNEPKKAEDDKPPVTKEKTEPAPRETASTTQTNSNNSQTSSNLPATGPADTAFSILAMALLTFATAHYARSRNRS